MNEICTHIKGLSKTEEELFTDRKIIENIESTLETL